MKIKTLALILCASFCVGLSSCKDDGRQDLPKVVKTESGVNPENTGGHAKYTGPMTHLQVSMTATYPAPVASKSRAFNTSFKQGNKGDNNLMQMMWEKDKVYTLKVCVRPNTIDWDASGPYADFKGKVISVSGYTYTKDGKEYGTGGTLRIQGDIDVPESYIGADNIYFAAYIKSEGVTRVDDSGPLVFQLPTKMVAVHNPQNENSDVVPTMNVLAAIPFTKVTLEKKGSGYKMVKADDPDNKSYKIEPVLSMFHFKLTNKLAYTIRFPEDTKVTFPMSTIVFGEGVLYDFWKRDVTSIGKENFFFHFGTLVPSGRTDGDYSPAVGAKYTLGIDYSNIPESLKSQGNGKKYITLTPGESIDFYVAGAPNRTPVTLSGPDAGTQNFEIDFSSLGIQYQAKSNNWVNYRAKYKTIYAYSDNKDNNGTETSDITQYSPSLEEDVAPLFYSAKNADPANYEQGKSYYKSFDVSSDLMIGLVGYRWDGITDDNTIKYLSPTKDQGQHRNFGLVQLYNPTNDKVDLSNYFLVRTLYKYNSHDITFCSEGWNFSTNFGYAVICPLISKGNPNHEFSPFGYTDKSVKYYHNDNNGNSGNAGSTNDYVSIYTVNSSTGEIKSKNGVIIGAQGFFGKGNNNGAQLEYAYNKDFQLADGSTNIPIIGIEDGYNDGRDDSGTSIYNNPPTPLTPQEYFNKKTEEITGFNCFYRAPGNAWSGVMCRGNGSGTYTDYSEHVTIGKETLNGWALVKKVPVGNRTKFVIVDTYGPCPTKENIDQTKGSTFATNFGETNYSGLVFLRGSDICQPYGAEMDLTNPKTNTSTTTGWRKFVSYQDGVTRGYGQQATSPIIGVLNR